MGQTVLLVEDDAPFAQMLTVVIQQLGFQVTHAATVRGAQEAIAREEFAAVVLDFGLPDGDARDVVPSLGSPPSVPVFIVSAERDVKRRLADTPVQRIFSKPLDTRAFRSELRAIALTC
jgi:two-component system response regulator QseB